MVIMLIFLLLSVLVVVGTVLYTKYNSYEAKMKKRAIERAQKNGAMQLESEETSTLSEKEQKEIKSAWGIQDIRNGVIKLNNNRLRTLVSLGSIDFWLLSEGEQTVIENQLMQACLSFQFPVQFFTTTDRIDTSSTISEIEKTIDNEDYPDKLRAYAKKSRQYLANLMESQGSYVRKSYAVICYDNAYDEVKSTNDLLRNTQIFINSLSRAKVYCRMLNSLHIVDLLHKELKKDSPIKPSEIISNGGSELYITGMGVLGDVDEETKRLLELNMNMQGGAANA